MDISISKQSKFVCLAMAIIMILSIFISAGTSVYASENIQEESKSVEQELVKQYAEDLKFIYENAAVVDSNGEIEQVNLSILREKYGNNEFFDYLQNNYGQDSVQFRGDFVGCMKSEFEKIIGLDIAKQVFSPEIKRLLATKAWKKASEIIVRTLGQKLGQKALGKLVTKMVPGGIPAQIIFSAGKCGIKAVWS